MFDKSIFDLNFFFKKPVALQNRKTLKRFIASMLQKESMAASGYINFIFCSDEELLTINQKFLNHDFYTDIVSFQLSEQESEVLEAEIYISIDRVRENSKALGISFKREFHRIIFHGILHLCGYKDKTEKEEKEMRRMEDLFLSKYFERST